MNAEQVEKAAALKNQFIPTGGAMIAADMYTPSEDPSKAPKRVRLPYQSLDWLVTTLEKQGMTLDKMESQNKGMLAEMADQIIGGAQAAPPQGAPQLRPIQGGTGV
jgi:hypothetical protein